LLADPEFDGADFAAKLLEHRHEHRVYGQGTALALARLEAGVPWQEAGAGQAGRGCYGNAAAARSAAVGLVYVDDETMLRWVAEEAAGVTHAHALGIEGAVVFTRAVALALATDAEDFDARSFFEQVAGDVQVREYRSHLEIAASLAGRRTAPAVIADRLGNNQTALGSVVTAILCFADNAESFTRTATAALRLGGNSTSLCSMSLALAGAHLGAGAIPRHWLDQMEIAEISAESIARLARSLAEGADLDAR
jgi:poly(ADP-ribose) glycohydrolase ARH3